MVHYFFGMHAIHLGLIDYFQAPWTRILIFTAFSVQLLLLRLLLYCYHILLLLLSLAYVLSAFKTHTSITTLCIVKTCNIPHRLL